VFFVYFVDIQLVELKIQKEAAAKRSSFDFKFFQVLISGSQLNELFHKDGGIFPKYGSFSFFFHNDRLNLDLPNNCLSLIQLIFQEMRIILSYLSDVLPSSFN
jgi:hypothetical protein